MSGDVEIMLKKITIQKPKPLTIIHANPSTPLAKSHPMPTVTQPIKYIPNPNCPVSNACAPAQCQA